MKLAGSAIIIINNLLNYFYHFFQFQMNIYLEQSSDTNGKLQSKYGSLQYLKNLEIRYKNSRIEEEACPVCQTSMDEKV